MYSAPSVSFPVGRSRFALGLALVLWGAGVAVTAVWCWQTAHPGWRHGLSAFMLGVCGSAALLAWRHTRAGEVHWDGLIWQWATASAADRGTVVVALDLQAVLLVLFSASGQPARWLWLERRNHAAAWPALRRAVYSPARNDTQREPQRAGVPAP